jgi:16S rRNA U516 pseudouridylate synthase RsuA-like enzyme
VFARTISISLKEGRNRQIRLMAEAIGMRVIRLHRVEFAGVVFDAGMSEGQLRALDEGEMAVVRGHLLAYRA